ncbi:MAG: ATP synthase F1 subunit delta [Desulfosalsimonadaceae bacterium]
MRSSAIARRYAKALMLIAKEDGQAETYREELQGFLDLFDQEDQLEPMLTNPLYSAESRWKVLEAVLQTVEISSVMRSFLTLLFNKGRIPYLRQIATYFNQLADELRGIVRADLISATELSSEKVEAIRGALSKMTGKDVVLDTDQDPSIIGGVVTKIGDIVLDGSVKTQLENMRESLKRGERV